VVVVAAAAAAAVVVVVVAAAAVVAAVQDAHMFRRQRAVAMLVSPSLVCLLPARSCE